MTWQVVVMNEEKNRLWLIGLAIVLVASFINGIFIRQEIGGLAREAMRFVILAGIALFGYGLIQKFRKKVE